MQLLWHECTHKSAPHAGMKTLASRSGTTCVAGKESSQRDSLHDKAYQDMHAHTMSESQRPPDVEETVGRAVSHP